MKSAISIPGGFVAASYGLLVAGLTAGTVFIPFSPRLALLPAAVIFGWSQLGGL